MEIFVFRDFLFDPDTAGFSLTVFDDDFVFFMILYFESYLVHLRLIDLFPALSYSQYITACTDNVGQYLILILSFRVITNIYYRHFPAGFNFRRPIKLFLILNASFPLTLLVRSSIPDLLSAQFKSTSSILPFLKCKNNFTFLTSAL